MSIEGRTVKCHKSSGYAVASSGVAVNTSSIAVGDMCTTKFVPKSRELYNSSAQMVHLVRWENADKETRTVVVVVDEWKSCRPTEGMIVTLSAHLHQWL